MTILRWRPRRYTPTFGELTRFLDTLRPSDDRPETRTVWRPRVDVAEEEDGWSIEVDLPGVPRENVKVTAQNGVLTIEGETPQDNQIESAHTWSERPAGAFCRRFRLPDVVDVAKVAARHSDGVLRVTLPKAEEARPREIAVSVN